MRQGLFAYRLAQGSASIPFWDIVGQTGTPVRLGGFIAYRDLFGGILGMPAGFLVGLVNFFIALGIREIRRPADADL